MNLKTNHRFGDLNIHLYVDVYFHLDRSEVSLLITPNFYRDSLLKMLSCMPRKPICITFSREITVGDLSHLFLE